MHHHYPILMLALLWLMTGCRGDELVYPAQDHSIPGVEGQGCLYILNEGNMGSNKAQIDLMNLATGVYTRNYYGGQNPNVAKELGDVGNDIQVYGSRMYAVINCSHKVEVMDLHCRRIGQVDLPNCRSLAFDGGRMYVSAYVGSVADPDLLGSVYEVDTATLQVLREVKVGHQPDELLVQDGLLYVCNSGGYLSTYDSTLSVVDIRTMTELRQVTVGINPQRIVQDVDGRLWVACQGNRGSIPPSVAVMQQGEVIRRISVRADNLTSADREVYALDSEHKTLSRLYLTGERQTMLDLSDMEHPYGLYVHDYIYVTDAKNYVSSGELRCYSLEGDLRWSAQTGDIPGHMVWADVQSDSTAEPKPEPRDTIRVYEYRPAPGQFVNTMPRYAEGDTPESMRLKAEQAINRGETITLGGWGGQITLGVGHSILNGEGRDFRILGNAFLLPGYEQYGASEPGIVMVSRDDNGNGLPDDAWYELAGSDYNDTGTLHHYHKTYFREADTVRNPFHTQPYYPQWYTEDSILFEGACLASTTTQIGSQWAQQVRAYGYADNLPNTDTLGTGMDISWAVDTDGVSVSLPWIDFIRIYTAVDETNELTGELSTEIMGLVIED